MTLRYSWPGPSGLASTTDARKALAGLLAVNTAGQVRAGVVPAHYGALLSPRADMNVDIAAFNAVGVQFGGPVLFSNDGTIQLTDVLVSPTSGMNYYVIYAKQNEATSPGTDANNDTVRGAVVSTVSFALARSGLPEGAVEIGTVQVPPGVTATNASGVIVTTAAPCTAAAGAVVALRSQADQDAWTPADGSRAYRIDLGRYASRVAGAWLLEFTDTPLTEYTTFNSGGGWGKSDANGFDGVWYAVRGGMLVASGAVGKGSAWTPGDTILTFPAGLRPPKRWVGTGVECDTGGNLHPQSTTSGGVLTFDIKFPLA